MRTMMLVQMPVEPFNTTVRNQTAASTMKRILEDAKPEAAYFTEIDGRRTGILIVDLKSPSEIPRFAEPWFLNFNAEVKFRTVMTPEDLAQADLTGIGQKWG